MKLHKKQIALYILLFIISTMACAQDIVQIGKGSPLKISGSISNSSIFYTAAGIDSRRDPFSTFWNGSLNFNLYGWSVPLNFSYSNQQGEFRQPFNQYGLSPKYKWITTHLGYRSMNFSSYSLSGHIFLGAGVELNPTDSKWNFALMYGRLRKAVAEDTINGNIEEPSYRRMGYAFKAEYGSNGDKVGMSIFRAKDELTSIPYVPEGITPQENLVLGITFNKKLLKRLSINGEFASSAMTTDTRDPEASADNILGNTALYRSRSSSSYNNAFKMNLNWGASFANIQFGYERIAPNYNTLGAYFFNNDLENSTLGISKRIFKDKLTLSVNGGIQRNNLNNDELSSTKRLIGSATASLAASQKVSINATYSNFTVFTRVQTENIIDTLQAIDSLDYVQVTQNASAGINYNFGSKTNKSSLGFNGSYQVATDDNPTEGGQGSKFYNGSVSYRYTVVPKDMGLTFSTNANLNDMSTGNSLLIGPSLGLNKSFFEKKWRVSLMSSYNRVSNDGQVASVVLSHRLSNSYVVAKKHNFSLGVAVTERKAQASSSEKLRELTMTFGYSYAFKVL